MKYAPALLLLLTATASAQPTWVQVQCYPGQSCQPYYYSPGYSGGMYVQPPRIDFVPSRPPQYVQPQYVQPYNPQIKPDGRPSPPAPSQGQLEPVKPIPTPVKPAEPQPDMDWSVKFEDLRKDIRQEISLLVATQPAACNCKPVDLTAITSQLTQINNRITSIEKQPSAPTVTAPARQKIYARIVPKKD
jgi:hypothetical protein